MTRQVGYVLRTRRGEYVGRIGVGRNWLSIMGYTANLHFAYVFEDRKQAETVCRCRYHNDFTIAEVVCTGYGPLSKRDKALAA